MLSKLRDGIVGLPWAADSCPLEGKLREVANRVTINLGEGGGTEGYLAPLDHGAGSLP
jgi:hypothetical protein